MPDLYLQSHRQEPDARQKQKKRRFLPLIYLSVACLVLAGILVGWRIYRNHQSQVLYTEFAEKWKAKDFTAAYPYFVKLREAASKQGNTGDVLEAKARLKQAEDSLRDLRESVFLRWNGKGTVELSPEEKRYFNQFADENTTYLKDYLTSLCNDILTKKLPYDRADSILKQMVSLTPVSHEAESIRALLPQFSRFTEDYKKALDTNDRPTQLKLFAEMRDSIKEPLLQPLKNFFAEKYTKYAEEWWKENETELQLDWDRGRYYSLRDRVNMLGQYYPNDSRWQTWKQKLDTLTLADLKEYTGPIPVIQVRNLVRHPSIAMRSSMRKYYMQKVLPQESITALFDSLYSRGYVLVDPARMVNDQGRYKTLYLPEGKKPVVILLTGLNYSRERIETGSIKRLSVEDGKLYSYSDAPDGTELREEDGEVTGLLDRFVAAHPDFSFDGARGVISLEGSKPVFGYYVTQRQLRAANTELAGANLPLLNLKESDIQKQSEAAAAVGTYLKNQGWSFASEGYDDKDFMDISTDAVEQDNQLWQESLGLVVGKSSQYYFRHGVPGPEDAKLQLLFRDGYHVYYELQEGAATGDPTRPFFLHAIDLNGLSLYFKKYESLVDSSKIYKGILNAKMYDPPKRSKKK